MDVDQHFEKALTCMGKQDWRGAVLIYKSILERQPELWRAWLNLAICHQNSAQYNEAKIAFQRVLAINPECYDAWFLISKSYAALNEVKAMMQALEKCVSLNPQHHEAWFDMYRSYAKREQEAEAIRCLKQYVGIHPTPDALIRLAKLHAKTQWGESVRYFQQAHELDPDSAYTLSRVALAYFRQCHFDEAKEIYEKVIKLDPSIAKVHFNLGNTHLALLETDAAIKCFNQCIALDPMDFEAYYNLGWISRDRDQSARYFKKTLEINPQCYDALSNYALVHTYHPILSPKEICEAHQFSDVIYLADSSEDAAWNRRALPARRLPAFH